MSDDCQSEFSAAASHVSRKKGLKLESKVDPWGKLNATPEHGAWLGNRGILHDDKKKIVKQWQHSGWVTCLLENRDAKREELFAEGSYSELFFLDEATAFSAGHRPCAQCRNKRYKEFKSAWGAANSNLISSENPPYNEMDKVLQEQRVLSSGGKKTYEALLGSLPAGTMIELAGDACLIWRGRLHRWSFAGYEPHDKKVALSTLVKVLTPESIVRMFAGSFVPQVHVSVFW